MRVSARARAATMPVLLLCAAAPLRAGQLLLPLDPATSTLTTRLKLTLFSPTTSTDTVPVSGFLLVDLDPDGTPLRIAARHFDVHAQEDFQFVNTVFLFTKLYTTVSGIQVFDAYPGPQEPHVALAGGAFATTNLWFLLKGNASYTGAASGTFELDASTPQPLANLSGTLQTSGGEHSVHADLAFTFPELIIPSVLGEVKVNISGTGSFNARVAVGALPPPAPRLSLGAPTGETLPLRWPSALWPTPTPSNTPAGYWPWRSTNLLEESAWEREPAPAHDDGTESRVEAARDAPRRFYRLEWR